MKGSFQELINNRSFICNKINRHLLFVNREPMTPRPRTVSDSDILTALHRTISRVGPARFTLADVARGELPPLVGELTDDADAWARR